MFLAPIGYLNAPRSIGKSLMPDPERAPIVRRVFEAYATERFTKQQVLEQARAWGLTNRRARPLTSQAIGTLLRNRLYAGIVDVPEYGVRAKGGDFEPLLSEDLFYRVQGVLSGRVPSTTPQQRAHPTSRVRTQSAQMPLGKGTTGARFQVPLERDRSLLVGKLDDDIDLPRPPSCRVKTAARVVRLEPGAPIAGDARVVALRVSGTAKHVNAAPGYPHAAADCRIDSGWIPLRCARE